MIDNAPDAGSGLPSGTPHTPHDPDDPHLRELFLRLRLEEELLAPRFIAPSAPALPVRARFWSLPGASACAATIALAIFAAILWLKHEPVPRVPARTSGMPVASITEWKPPTDFLLKTPGREMLRTAPVLDLQPWPTASPDRRQPPPPVRSRGSS